MNTGCCNKCGYKADYIIDNNNYEANGYEDLDQVPLDEMLCGACYEENQITCDYCQEYDLKEYLSADIRPYDIFCSHDCIEQHKRDIASGEWDNHEGENLRHEYAEEIKNNWRDLDITKESII